MCVLAYAAAFFLLGGDLEGAVEVCLHQLNDVQLAVAISRVYEGDDGPVLQKLLREDVLSQAAQEGNRWLASWAFWMLGRKDMAVRALVVSPHEACWFKSDAVADFNSIQAPVYTLIETPSSPDIKSRLFLTDDPALVVLYSQLRQQTLSTLRGASKVSPRVEWEFVLHSAKLYDRMGCDLLGLDLGMFFVRMEVSNLSPVCIANTDQHSSQLGVPEAHNDRSRRGDEPTEASEAAKLACCGRPAVSGPAQGDDVGRREEDVKTTADDV